MHTNKSLEHRRDAAVAKAIAYSATFVADRAENAEVWDVEGKRYIDFCGGIGCQNTGHRHPGVVKAIKDQLDTLTHTCFQVTPYESYIELAERLNAVYPGDFKKKSMFFSAGGEAVENAIKIARYYTKRPALITFTNGYHGRSYMGMALSARMVPFKQGFGPFPGDIFRLPFPDDFRGVGLEDTKRAFELLFRSDCAPDQIAAIFFEPVQGEGGYNIASQEFVEYLRIMCDEHGIVLVADEIQSGMGRTGKMFAMEHYGIDPDLTCVGKSIGGGLPISGVVGKAHIIDEIPPAFSRFCFITLPHLSRAITVVVLIKTIFLLSIFAEIFVTTAGAFGTKTLTYLIFQRVLESQNVGLGSAGGVYAIILANIVAIFLMRIVGKNLDR